MAASDRVAAAHQMLVALVEGLQSGTDWQAALATAARLHRYSFANAMLIMSSHAGAHREGRVPDPVPDAVAGYRTWQGLGRHVVAGQRGHTILRPILREVRLATGAGGATRRLQAHEQPRRGESVSRVVSLVGYSTGTVFSRSQTEGAELALAPQPVLLSGQAPPGLWDGVAGVLRDAGFTVHDTRDAAALDGANGRTDPAARTVHVRADMDPAARVKTLLHETGHALLHATAATDPAGRLVCRGVAEVEAESVAFVVAAAHGMDTSAYTLPYVATWADGPDPAATVRATADRVVSTARTILTGLGTEHGLGGQPPGIDRPHTRPSGRPPGRAPQPAVPSVERGSGAGR